MAATVRTDVEGLNELLRQMSRAPREVQGEIRDASVAIIERSIVPDARRRARRGPPQLRAVAQTIKGKRDRIPALQAGGAKRVTSSGAKAGQIYFGASFGSNRLKRFPARVVGGRDIYPAIEDNQDEAADQWLDAVERVMLR